MPVNVFVYSGIFFVFVLHQKRVFDIHISSLSQDRRVKRELKQYSN